MASKADAEEGQLLLQQQIAAEELALQQALEQRRMEMVQETTHHQNEVAIATKRLQAQNELAIRLAEIEDEYEQAPRANPIGQVNGSGLGRDRRDRRDDRRVERAPPYHSDGGWEPNHTNLPPHSTPPISNLPFSYPMSPNIQISKTPANVTSTGRGERLEAAEAGMGAHTGSNSQHVRRTPHPAMSICSRNTSDLFTPLSPSPPVNNNDPNNRQDVYLPGSLNPAQGIKSKSTVYKHQITNKSGGPSSPLERNQVQQDYTRQLGNPHAGV